MGDVDFVHDVCSQLPSQVIGQLMGLPPEDCPRIHAWAERQTSGQDADFGADEAGTSSSIEMAMYAIEFGARRRREPAREDLTSLILSASFGGEPMSDIDFGSFFVQLVTAGNDTTKTMLSSGALALLQHPAQLAEIRQDPSLIPVGGGGDPAMGQPAALLPAHRHRGHRGERHLDRAPARSWR